jgi:multidrug efflux pump subunit AcrB
MTLGGLALAVGILVDDATVEIENIHRNIAMGKPLKRAILDGAQQIAVPAFVATTAISIVFLSVLFLEGAARYLFMGMALAVGISVMASYFLSRTIIPTLVMYLLKDEAKHHGEPKTGFFGRIIEGFERRFDAFRHGYVNLLDWALHHRKAVFAVFLGAVVSALALAPFVGRDFFPAVDAGQIRLHVVAPAGTRIEESEKLFTAVAGAVKQIIPEHERHSITDIIGVPDGINLAVTDSNIVSSADGEMLISLDEHHKTGTAEYVKQLRTELAAQVPATAVLLRVAGHRQPDPELRRAGADRHPGHRVQPRRHAGRSAVDPRPVAAGSRRGGRSHPPGAGCAAASRGSRSAAHDRGRPDAARRGEQRAGRDGQQLQRDAKLLDRSGHGLKYGVSVETPKRLISDVQDLQNLNLPTRDGGQLLLSDAATIERRVTPVVANHSNIQPTFNVRAAVQGTDLGSVGPAIERIVNAERAKLPPGATISVHGQVQSMTSAFGNLALGIVFAAVLVYLLMVVNFQSWTDPFIILTALGGALVGIVWMLYVTRTTFSVPSLMGAIMAVGVATANSILMVTFANSRRHEAGDDALHAALAAGYTRLRPVIMTALAMILGMLPMSLGLGEGGEQNAPLGRAGDRRVAGRNRRNAVLRAGRVHPAPQQGAAPAARPGA